MSDAVPFDVYILAESNHSGVLSNVLRLNPNNRYDVFQRMQALVNLEEYADKSLTAYNAVEYWSLITDDWWPGFFELREAAIEILKRVEKPKRILVMSSEWVEVK